MALESLTIEKLLAHIKAKHQHGKDRIDAAVQRVTSALNSYAMEAHADLIRDLAEGSGVPISPGFEQRKAPAAAQRLLEALDALPELGGAGHVIEAVAEDAPVKPDAHVPFYGLLDKVTRAKKAMLFGGEILNERLPWLEERGVACEHFGVPASTGSYRDAAKAVQRIQGGNVSFVLFAGGFVSHSAGNQVKQAASKMGVPIIDVRKAGQGQLSEALERLNREFVRAEEKGSS
jgi:hypothetical protein